MDVVFRKRHIFTDMNTFRLENVSIGYGKKTVAREITAEMRGGAMTCLIGVNGVGKSTLLRTLAGFQRKLAGCIFLYGRELGRYSAGERARMISVVLTANSGIRNLTVEEVVGLGRSPYTGFWGSLDTGDRKAVDGAIRMTGIEPLRQRMVHTLSDGERQRVMVAKALAQQTPVMILDEPTAFLDFPGKAGMMRLLHRLAHELGKTVLLSTHDLSLAMQVADTLWLMDSCRGIHTGSPEELANDGSLQCLVGREGMELDTETLSFRIGKRI